MPTKPRVEPDLAMQRACRLVGSIWAAIPASGCSAGFLNATLRGFAKDFTAAEIRAAKSQMQEWRMIDYEYGVWTRRGAK